MSDLVATSQAPGHWVGCILSCGRNQRFKSRTNAQMVQFQPGRKITEFQERTASCTLRGHQGTAAGHCQLWDALEATAGPFY